MHLDEGNDAKHQAVLRNVGNLLDALGPGTEVAHGAGISLCLADSLQADEVQALIGRAVAVVACENTNTLRTQAIALERLASGVATVPGLVVLVAGNQYMVMPDLIADFLSAQRAVASVFYETLPPGIVIEQFRCGGLRMGSLELRVAPDVIALTRRSRPPTCRRPGRHSQDLRPQRPGPVGRRRQSCRIASWADLALPGVRVAFPDPRAEGVGRLALEAIEATGGADLRSATEGRKAAAGEVVFANIHHRQSPAWLAAGMTDVAVVWSTDARHDAEFGARLDSVTIPAAENSVGSYGAATVNDLTVSRAPSLSLTTETSLQQGGNYGICNDDQAEPAI